MLWNFEFLCEKEIVIYVIEELGEKEEEKNPEDNDSKTSGFRVNGSC